MNGTTKIENLGTIELDGVSVGDGRLEVHIPIKNISNQLDATLEKCYEDFKEKHPELNESQIFHDIQLVFSSGGFRSSLQYEAEFMLMVIVWDESNESDAEFYEEIPVELNEEDSKKLRKIVWDGLGEMLFGI